MKILSWNVNGMKARLDAVNRLAEAIKPDIMCVHKVKQNGGFFHEVPSYMGWLGPIYDGLFGGVSTYTKHGLEPENSVSPCGINI